MHLLPYFLRGQGRGSSLEDGLGEKAGPSSQPVSSHLSGGFPPEKLVMYRHLLGIYSTSPSTRIGQQMDHSQNPLHFEGRLAPNLGIYQRVVHREQQAKKGYKSAALLINSCLGLQVIVAAALTAMGAANSSHHAITAFGAVNTVIAGFLTYLKGSGLPNRIRYYEKEWKRVREYIEQRERDFARPDCDLDVYEAVKIIESMYEEVKVDIATNTPENYVSVGELRARVTASQHPIPEIAPSAKAVSHGAASKLQEMELKYGHKVADVLENLSKKENDRLATLEASIGGQRARLDKEIEGGRSFFERAKTGLQHEFEGRKADLVHRGDTLEKEIGSGIDERRRQVERSRTEMSQAFEDHKNEITRREAEYERGLQSGIDDQRQRMERTVTDASHTFEQRTADLAQRGQSYRDEVQTGIDAQRRNLTERGDEFSASFGQHKDEMTRKEIEYEKQLQAEIDAHKAKLAKRENEIQDAVHAQKVELAGREAQLQKDLDLKAAQVAELEKEAEREARERREALARIAREAEHEVTKPPA